MNEHPSDEFDRVPEVSARQGVHRGRLMSSRADGWAPKIVVAVLALLLVIGALLLVPRLGLTANDGGASDQTSSPAPSAGATDDDEPSADPTAPVSAAADRDQVVNVLNATGSPGLATVAAGRLAAAGWTSAVPGNWAGAPLDGSVVFYNGEAQRAAAEAVAEELAISEVIESLAVSPDISVVLGPDFQ